MDQKNSNQRFVKEKLVLAILIVKLLKAIGEFLPVAIDLFNMAFNYFKLRVCFVLCRLNLLGFISLK
ncbi:hypothetical protein FS418_04885 [Shewanella sp. YLB-09]|uniref:Uncharacterized protein n=1 Tax=Shewanella eurypsychrophilus TaxID=2593656 RepID=A0A550AC73_9GAMM|nr:hypothetical protein FS418_04885 [Shewanella sp. YLB-09]